MATLQGKAVKNTYRQVLQIGANNVGVSGTLQPVQDGTGTNTALSLSTAAATINGTLTITGDLIITGGGIQIQDLIDDTVASLIQNGTGITWAYNDTLRTLTPTITIATADGGAQADYFQFNVNAAEASAVGKLKWNTTDGTMDIGLMGGNVVLQVGQEQVARVLNNSGTIFTEAGYQVVKITSAQGQRLAVGLAQANNEANSKDTLGLVTENIANNQEGFVTTSGLVREIDTTGDLQTEAWIDGDTLYLSPSVPGGITKVKPLAPQQTVIVGFVVYAHKNHGKIFVKVDNGYEISELHDVRITSVANNNVLKYNSSLAVWENVAPITTWITEGTNLYYTQGRFDSAFAAKSTTDLAEGTNLYFTTARGDANFATNFATKTTTNLPEGTNLYFTNQRFDSRFSTKTTTDLAEGTNLYYTQARFNTAFAAKSTTDLAEGTNLYYTDARARLAISESAVGLDYSNTSGVFSLTAGYAIPTTVKLGQYDTAYNRSIVSAGVAGTTTKTLSLTQQDANVITASWTDQGITTINGTANQIAANTVGNTTTIAFTNDVTMPNNLVVSGNLTINGTATYVNTQSISAKDPLFEVANDNNTTDAVDIGYYGRYFDSAQTRVEFTGLFRDASDAGKFKFFTGLTVEPTNVVDTTGTGYTVGTLVANVEGSLAGTANAANTLTTARTIAASGDATWSVSFNGSANVSSALTLANTGVTATTYGTTTAVPTIAIDSKGRITSASNTNIAFPVTTVNGFSGTVVLTTSDVAEGTNQYFTSAKAQASITGGASSVVTANLTASRALVSDGSGKIAASATTTTTEIGYLAGVTSAIQTQLNGKLNLTGGTLTGPLNGTSASFSTSVGIGTGATIANDITWDNNTGFGLKANDGTRYLSYTTAGGTILGSTGSAKTIIQGNGGSVGIGTTNPQSILDIRSANIPRIQLVKTGIIGWYLGDTQQDGTNLFSIGTDSGSNFRILNIDNGGKVGIGTTTIDQLLTVAGNISLGRYNVATSRWIGLTNGGAGFGDSSGSNIEFTSPSGTSNGINFYTYNGSTYSAKLQIASSGASTFSSSVTATGGFEIPNGQFYRARRTSGNLLTDMIGIPSATDDVRILTTGAFKVVSGGLTTFLNISDAGAATFLNELTVGSPTANATLNLSGDSGGGDTFLNFKADSSTIKAQIQGGKFGGTSGMLYFKTLQSSVLTTAMVINQNGNLGIGNPGASDIRLYITGQSTTSSNFALVAYNSSNQELLLVRNDGLYLTGTRTNSPYNYNVTFAPRTAGLDASGGFGYITSVRESKGNIETINNIDFVKQLNPVSFNYRKKNADNTEFIDELYDDVYYGFVADEVEALDKNLVFYDDLENGSKKLSGVHYNSMIAILTKAVQELKAEIDQLKAK